MTLRFAALAGFALLAASLAPSLQADEREETRVLRRAQVVELIDSIIDERLKLEAVEPAAPASDDEFLRRASLDLSGVIPSASRAREYLLSDDPQKRAALVEELLRSPRFATHQADLWSARMLSDPNSLEAIADREELRRWFRTKFRENYRYDRIVAEFVSATGTRTTGPSVFYRRQEFKPEKLAAATSRIFLGVHLECAQCHNHPFDKWSQGDFWSLAAFFARVGDPGMANMASQSLVEREEGEVMLPDTDEVVPPRFPGSETAVEEFGGRRTQLAIWMTSRDNPFLAKAAVNRVWSQLFGEGIVEPVDDLSPRNPPSHPEILDALADWFVETGYDLKELYRTLALTKAYARSSRYEGKLPSKRLWAYMPVKALTPEQLYDSIVAVGGGDAGANVINGVPQGDQGRAAFAARMAFLDRPATEYQGGIPQALMFLNGGVLRAATAPETSRIVGSLSAPLFTNEERVEALYVATLSRFPTAEERDLALDFYDESESPEANAAASSDLLWALLNSGEFAMRR